MGRVYVLDEREGVLGASKFLCDSVEGFEGLWEEYAGTSLSWFNLERFLSRMKRFKPIECFEIAEDIRKEVRLMLPCYMSAKEFKSIVDKHIDKYF